MKMFRRVHQIHNTQPILEVPIPLGVLWKVKFSEILKPLEDGTLSGLQGSFGGGDPVSF